MSEAPVSNPSGGALPDDAQLIAQAKGGHRDALDQLVLRHQQTVFAVALRMLGNYDDATEVAQDAFVRAYRALDGFRGQAKFSTWLISITMNLCRNKRRWWSRHKRVVVASIDDPVETGEETLGQQLEDPGPSPADVAQQRESSRFLMQALQKLDGEQRGIIVLRDVEGYSYEEIAHVLSCRVGTVKSRLARARAQLRVYLDGKP